MKGIFNHSKGSLLQPASGNPRAEIAKPPWQQLLPGGAPPPPTIAGPFSAVLSNMLSDVTLNVEQVRELAANVGTHFMPLVNFGNAASFLWSLFSYPAGVPHRMTKIAESLTSYPMVYGLAALVRRVDGIPEVQSLLSTLPPVGGMELITDLEKCVVCDAHLVSDVFQAKSQNRESGRACTSPTVYGENGPVSNVTLWPKRCKGCQALHYLSYAEGGTLLAEDHQQYYDNSPDARWFHVTREIVWSTKLLRQYEVQAVCSHSGFDTFMSEYGLLHGGAQAAEVNTATRRRLAHAFFAWSVLKWAGELEWPTTPAPNPNPTLPLPLPLSRPLTTWAGELEWPQTPLPLGSIERLDETLLKLTPDFSKAFTEKWGKHHTQHCRSPGNCISMSADGHMKARRNVCKNKWARVRVVPGLGKLVLNCTHTPMKGSYFCKECRAAAAHSGTRALVLAGGIVGGAGAEVAVEPAAEPDDDWRAARGWTASARDEVEKGEKDVFMVEDILEHKPGTQQVLGSQHTSCTRAKKNMYKISWLGWDSSFDSWVCGCSVGKAALEEYNAKRAGRRTAKKVGQLAAAWNAALDQPEASDGDFATTAADEQAFKQVSCEC